jgi:hypothetical protein
MARLEDLFPDFTLMNEEQQTAFVRAYRARRAVDLLEVTTYAVKKAANKLTPEESALLKSLGISAKDLRSLKALSLGEVEDEDNEEELDGIPRFNDDD